MDAQPKDVVMMTAEIQSLISRGAVFYCSHSGGKDSQAMYALMMRHIPADQIVVVHADLGEIEWAGVQTHITANISHPLNRLDPGLFGSGRKRPLQRDGRSEKSNQPKV